jgi:hypothetical protein
VSVTQRIPGVRRLWAWASLALLSTMVLVLLAGSPPARAGSVVAGPSLRATLLSSRSGSLRLEIRRAGRLVYNARVRSRTCGSSCTPTAIAPGRGPIRALEVGPDQPVVLLGLFSGGAHCCFSDQLYVFNRRRDTFTATETNFFDDDPRLVPLGRGFALRGADARVAEAYFTDFAHSGAPFAEWSITEHGIVDITRRFPAAIAADAARWWRAFRSDPRNGVGYIAAWAADEDLLGHRATVASRLAAELRAGRLRSSLSGRGHSGASFVSALQTLLRHLGDTRR